MILNNINKKTWYFIICLFGVSLFWAWRIHFGAADAYLCPDESFFISIPYRLLFGDRLFFDETNTTQLVGFLLYPIIKAWHNISNGDTEGIILIFRYIWLFCHLIVSSIIYFLIQNRYRDSNVGIFCFIFYSLVVPFSATSLSYNTIALGCTSILVLLYFLSYDSLAFEIIKGVLCSIIVLCNPFNIFLYLLIVLNFIFNYKNCNNFHIKVKHFIAFHFGICLLFIPFVIYIYISLTEKNTNILGFIDNIRYLISIDAAHPTSGGLLVLFVKKIIVLFFNIIRHYYLFVIIYIFLLFLVLILKKNKINTMFLIFALCILSSFVEIFSRSNYPMIFFIYIGIALSIIEKRLILNHSELAIHIVLAFILTTHFASNNGLHAVAWASIPGAILSFILCNELYIENKLIINKKVVSILCILCCCSILFLDLYYIYQDDNIWKLNIRINEGPLRGIYTTQAHANKYNIIYSELNSIELSDDDNVLVYPTYAIDLLSLKREVCSPSTWFVQDSLDSNSLSYYYSTHKDKIPTVIFINKLCTSLDKNDVNWLVQKKSYRVVKENENCIILRL